MAAWRKERDASRTKQKSTKSQDAVIAQKLKDSRRDSEPTFEHAEESSVPEKAYFSHRVE